MTVTDPLEAPSLEIERDRFGRPLIIPPGGGKPIPYTRCTTFVDCLEDKFNLQRWQQRMVATGLVDRPDLQLAVSAHREDKRRLNELCEEAIQAAQGRAAATSGTAMHSLSELVDRGQEIPQVSPTVAADLEAYREATSRLEVVAIEQFGVHDDYKIGGTWDRIVRLKGRNYIADLKTGSIDWGMLKIAMQLAVYSRCHIYDPATGERTPLPDVSQTAGIVIHLPVGQATCDLYWVNLTAGWDAVQTAKRVREWRSLKKGDLSRPLNHR